MINFENAKMEFNKYVSTYDINIIEIKRKYIHTFDVIDNCKLIAQNLNLTNEEINLAMLIGLLHDIGRFEQVTRFNSYNDKKTNFDHAKYAVSILFDNDYIRKYIENNIYDDIIKTAVGEHNKFKIDENLSDTQKLFCNIIRDADKIDILKIISKSDCTSIWNCVLEDLLNSKINPKIYNDFMQKKLIDSNDIISPIDHIIQTISYIFDLNFNKSYYYILENDYINLIIDKYIYTNETTINQLKEIKKFANDFMQKKVNS